MPLRILIVDDNADSADSLASLLELDGHVATPVYSAQDALDKVASTDVDAVVLDIGLPQMDGYEVARRIRQLDRGAGIRLIALSGYGQKEDREKSEAAGFDDHLVKPADFAMLAAALDACRRQTVAAAGDT